MGLKYLAMLVTGFGAIFSAIVFGILRPSRSRKSVMADKANEELLRDILKRAPSKTLSIQELKATAKISSDTNERGATRYVRSRLTAIKARPIPHTKPELWKLK